MNEILTVQDYLILLKAHNALQKQYLHLAREFRRLLQDDIIRLEAKLAIAQLERQIKGEPDGQK